MKKTSILLLAAIFLFSACTKESKTVNNPAAKASFSNNFTPLVTQPGYTDMVLQTRQPGENFDTYGAYWNNCLIKAKGPLYYDMVKYPNLVNGVPVIPAEISTYDGTSRIGWVNSASDGVDFEVTQSYLGGLPSTSFQFDYDTYVNAWSAWASGGEIGTEPTLTGTLATTHPRRRYQNIYRQIYQSNNGLWFSYCPGKLPNAPKTIGP
jgi:hypothetical protein